MNNESSLISDEKSMNRSAAEYAKDLWLLMKPELTLLSVFTSLGSAYLAIKIPDASQFIIFPLLALGTLFVGGGSGVLNQYFERDYDVIMKRTQKRPIPDGRIGHSEALIFGVFVSLIGTVLLMTINWLTALLSLVTLSTYVFLYTPLKRISPIATIIGAIPGALPTLIGWAAIQNSLSSQSLTLFAILFYWQMPHFYSIGWLYREDYSRAGFRLLTSLDNKGRKVSKQILVNQIILIGVSLSPAFVGLVTLEYIPVAVFIGLVFLLFGVKFNRSIRSNTSNSATRWLFFSSLFYLPIIFSAMIIFKN